METIKSIEQKAKRYDEALERAKFLKENTDGVGAIDVSRCFEEIFPELKESEDEKIRGELIRYLKARAHSGFNKEVRICNDGIAWLEKQGEQKEADEIHPIFRVGDYIKNKKTKDKILIEQLDVKSKTYCYTSYDGVAKIHSDFPFSKQYEWELIGQNIVEQKFDWSEEDEQMLQKTLSIIRYALSIPIHKENDPCFVGSLMISWLKSLKDRIQLQPKQEWSEEDYAILGLIQDAVDKFDFDSIKTYYTVSDWIKLIRTQK